MSEHTDGLDFEARREAMQRQAFDELASVQAADYDGPLDFVQALHDASGRVLSAHGNAQMRLTIKPQPEMGTAADARRLRALLRFLERRKGVTCGIFELIASDKGIQIAWASPMESDSLPELYEFHARAQAAAWGYADLMLLAFYQVARERLPFADFQALMEEAMRDSGAALRPHTVDDEASS